MQAGGSMGALAGYGAQSKVYDTLAEQAEQNRKDSIASRHVSPDVANQNYAAFMTTLNQQRASLQAGLGDFNLSPQTGSALDTAAHSYNMMLASPFVPGNRLTAGTSVLGALAAARGEAQKFLDTADLNPSGRRNIQQQIFGYQEQEQRLRETLNVGWMGRIASQQIMAPSHGAMVGVSARDYLMVDPTGNRMIGTASRRSYEYRNGAAYASMGGTGAASRPGDMNAQASNITVTLQGNGFEILKRLGMNATVSVQNDVRHNMLKKVPGG
jgi:hypothetical protein